MIPNAFTVDVEDYFHVSAFARRVRPDDWGGYESRVIEATRRILRVMASHEVRGTYFILGWVADRFPELVQEIADNGHEIGTHSYWHQLVYEQSAEEFREDLRRSLDAIETACGIRPTSYRAPSFSIIESSQWALDILIEEGITVDSSIFPIRHDRYGIPTLNPSPHRGPLGREGIWEVPPSIVQFGGLRVPVAGGGYFRIFPEPVMRGLHSRLLNAGERPLVFYIHPWEVDAGQPRIECGPLTRFRHYRNLHITEERLHRLFERVPFGTLGELVEVCESKSLVTQEIA